MDRTLSVERFLRGYLYLVVHRAGLCLGLWVAICMMLSVHVWFVEKIHLTDPQLGWRVRSHPTAEAMDAIILASRQSVAVAGILGDTTPAAPPTHKWAHPPPQPPPLPPLQLGRALLESSPQTEKIGGLKIYFTARGGRGNMLTAARLDEVSRLERAIVQWLSEQGICRLNRAPHGTWACVPARSISAYRPTSTDVAACVANATAGGESARGGRSSGGGLPSRVDCEATELARRIEVGDPTMAYAVECEVDYFGTGGDCAWTVEWACPMDGRGTRGYADIDGSTGYHCCCERPALRANDTRYKEARRDAMADESRATLELLVGALESPSPRLDASLAAAAAAVADPLSALAATPAGRTRVDELYAALYAGPGTDLPLIANLSGALLNAYLSASTAGALSLQISPAESALLTQLLSLAHEPSVVSISDLPTVPSSPGIRARIVAHAPRPALRARVAHPRLCAPHAACRRCST